MFQAFAKEEAKDKWFAGPPAMDAVTRSFDFREGGLETLAGRWESGMVTQLRLRLSRHRAARE